MRKVSSTLPSGIGGDVDSPPVAEETEEETGEVKEDAFAGDVADIAEEDTLVSLSSSATVASAVRFSKRSIRESAVPLTIFSSESTVEDAVELLNSPSASTVEDAVPAYSESTESAESAESFSRRQAGSESSSSSSFPSAISGNEEEEAGEEEEATEEDIKKPERGVVSTRS